MVFTVKEEIHVQEKSVFGFDIEGYKELNVNIVFIFKVKRAREPGSFESLISKNSNWEILVLVTNMSGC